MASETDITGTTPPIASAPPVHWVAETICAAPPIETEPPQQLDDSLQSVTSAPESKKRLAHDPRVIPGLVSTILHTVVLILFALLTLPVDVRESFSIRARQGEATPVVKLEALPKQDDQRTTEASLAERPTSVAIAWAEPSEIASPVSHEPRSAPLPDESLKQLSTADAPSARVLLSRIPSGGGLSGRTPEGRKQLGERFGATAESEQAVENALQWLANHQRPNGSWSFNLELDPCNGRCRHSKKNSDTATPSTGATGLALLAFLGAGYTHQGGKYEDVVRDGLYYLRSAAADADAGVDWQQGSMYGQGIALMAVAEALYMSRNPANEQGDSDLRELVTQAMTFTTYAQHANGSWGYLPGKPGDTTLTGWQVLSLLATRRNKIPLHYHTLPHARDYVLSTSVDAHYAFAYKPGMKPDTTNTAIGLTLLMYLGKTPSETPMQQALTAMASRGPKLTNVYHDYYGTLALHHSRHPGWDRWNARVRDHLVRTQSTAGHEAGSWHFPDEFGDVGGRLYTTAMSAMILEIYYRYLPLYDEIEAFPL
ncbi:prenyltransferase/squalene oxidase repeat-containing protein [Novipirellula caenicola]|uniref:Squalene cyclase C-terminal domain-containing protein n=1 Tax=Novipirellula caenicola TaxID=1536901 RepID=A0ABP9VUX1_9BACT